MRGLGDALTVRKPPKTLAAPVAPRESARGLFTMPEEAIDPRMLEAGFDIDPRENPEGAARLAVQLFEQGSPQALIRLAEQQSPIDPNLLERLGRTLYESGAPNLRRVSATARKVKGRKRKPVEAALAAAITRLYEEELTIARNSGVRDPPARDRAADAVVARPEVKWVGLTRNAVKRIVTFARKNATRKNAA